MSPWPNRVGIVVLGGIALALPAGCFAEEPTPDRCLSDSRCSAVRNLFLRYKSPLHSVAHDFVTAADRHKLDWRLLPGIAMVETGGGKAGRRYNAFGWNSGRARFPSYSAGIAFVAARFSQSKIYRGRSSTGILRQYNPNRTAYPPKVIRFMKELSPESVE